MKLKRVLREGCFAERAPSAEKPRSISHRRARKIADGEHPALRVNP